MKNAISTAALLTSILLPASALVAPSAFACGGVNESAEMCVAVPKVVSDFLLDDTALKLLQQQKHVRHIGATGTRVQIAISDSRCVTGDVSSAGVSWVAVQNYRWGVGTDFFVRVDDYAPLAKLLLSPLLSSSAAQVRAEGGHITSLYQLSNGQPLIRINGTSSHSYSLVGVVNAQGEITSIEVRP